MSTQAQERNKLRETDQLADTTFRNIEEFMDDMRGMILAAKAYHKAMQSMARASDNFFTLLKSTGAKASNLPGSVRKLGDCMLEMVSSHENTRANQEDWIQSLNTDFIVPMEMKLNGERKNLIREHKIYHLESSKRRVKLRKTTRKFKKIMKSKDISRVKMEKKLQLKHVLAEDTEMVHTTCVEGLRTALIEERKLYCFCVDHFCSVLQNQISYNATSHCVLSPRVNDWSSLCSSPNELPPESTALLNDPCSTRAFPPSRLMDSDTRLQGSMLADALQMGGGRSKEIHQRRMSCRVKALFPHHHNTTSGEGLEFNPGDLIDAIDEPQDGWQYGENTRTGDNTQIPRSASFSNSLQLGGTPDYLHHQQGSGSCRSSLTSSSYR